MGHQRLGTLPRSKSWKQVVGLIADGADVAEVAAAVAGAAENSMIEASDDAAVRYSFWLLSKIPLAARESNFRLALQNLGVQVDHEPMLANLVSSTMAAIDEYVRLNGERTDFGEIAQVSAAEAMHAVFGREMVELFEPTSERAKQAVAGFATVNQFAILARDFFSRVTYRHIGYYLSRELSSHVGPGQRFPSVREHRAFEQALDQHCREATRVIQEYSGQWLSKHNFEGGIDLGKAGRFVSYAASKIRDELRARRGSHA